MLVQDRYVAGSGDLHIQLHILSVAEPNYPILSTTTVSTKSNPVHQLKLQITKIADDSQQTVITNLNIYPDLRLNVTQIKVSCEHFLYAGLYDLEVIYFDPAGVPGLIDERMRQRISVTWPLPKLSVMPKSVHTYPEVPVEVILEFPEVECATGPETNVSVPEFWLEVVYCGREANCDIGNVSKSQVVYSEQVRGYPRRRSIRLRCELIGLAGNYIVKLRPTAPSTTVSATAFIKVNGNALFILSYLQKLRFISAG